MSAPSPPQINPLPRVDATQIQFWWDPPLSDGGSAVTSYTLSCTSPSLTFTAGADQNTYLVTGLTTGVSYAFTITANNTNGSSSPAAFNPVICGNFPSPPQNVGISSVGATGAKIQWDPPTSDGGAALTYYAVTADPLYPDYISSTQFGVPGTQTQRYTNGQTLGQNFRYLVNAINNPGWSDPVSTTYAYFTPSNLPGITQWFDAAQKNSLSYNVDTVITEWANKAPLGSNMLSDPTRSNVLSNEVFGPFPAVRFTNATGTYFANNDVTNPNVPGGVCAFFAVLSSITVPAGTGINYIFTSLTAAPPAGCSMLLNGTASPAEITTTIGGTANVITETQISPYTIVDPFLYSYILGTTEAGAGIQKSFYNGDFKTQTTSGGIGGVGFVLGNQPDVNAGDGFNGELCEWIFCEGDVSQSARQKTEGYLAWKWGLNSRLPPTHPWYGGPPPA